MSATAYLDLQAFNHNLARARAMAPAAKVIAVVKANAYGHGAIRVARALAGADAFAVARMGEALALREAGITQPIVLLPGVASIEMAELASEHDLEVVVHHDTQVAVLERARPARPVRVWLKVDTGMHRLGVEAGRAPALWSRLEACASVAPPTRLMTHLASADDLESPATGRQLAVLEDCARRLGRPHTSAANSAGVLGWPQSHGHWIRPGLMLYGISPLVGGRAASVDLRPVMRLQTRVIAVNAVRRGEPVGYGGTWVSASDARLAVAAIGYGDGYPRHAPSGTPVLVNGARAALAGRVSMDMITIDVSRLPGVGVGDPVVLWGANLPVEEVAEHAGTIPYELVCRVAPRVEVVVSGQP